MRILVSLATYNERENLPALVESIRRALPTGDLLVIDDNSPDGTGQWCAQQAERDPHFHCIHRPGKLGLGTAAIAGMRYAIDHDYDLLVTMDADFSHDPQQIPQLVAAASENDVVIGSRYVTGGRILGWPRSRRIMSRLVNQLARLLLGLPTRDNSGQFRCYRVDFLRGVDLSAIRSQGYSVFEELVWQLHRHGARLTEVPIQFVDRRQGESKLDRHEALRSVGTLLALGARRWFGPGPPPDKSGRQRGAVR